MSADSEIRLILDAWSDAIRLKNVDGRTAHYATDAVLFDVVDPLQYKGVDAVRRRAQEWFDTWIGPLGFEYNQVTILAAENVAFAHCMNKVKGTKTDGSPLEMWWRATVGFERRGDKWLVTHEHQSVPFDPKSGKASIDLKP